MVRPVAFSCLLSPSCLLRPHKFPFGFSLLRVSLNDATSLQAREADAMSPNQTLLVNIWISEKLKDSCYFGSWRAKFREEIPEKEPGLDIDNPLHWEIFLSLSTEQEDHFLQTLAWNRIFTSPPATYNRKEENYLSPNHGELKTVTIKQTKKSQTNENHFSFHLWAKQTIPQGVLVFILVYLHLGIHFAFLHKGLRCLRDRKQFF